MKLILTRHGHVEGIAPERFRGRMDLALTERGQDEARQLGRRTAAQWSPAAIFCSPLKRCVVTAQEIGAACKVAPQPLETLNDIDYGAWQFETHAAMKARFPELHDDWLSAPERVRFPEGESLQDVAARAADALRSILAAHHENTVVIVAHDSVNRVMLCQLLGLPLAAYWRFAQSPCCINEIDIDKRSVRLIRMNATEHLEGLT